MARKSSVSYGNCGFCGGRFSKAAITRHFQSCRKRQDNSEMPPKTGKREAFHLVVEGRYASAYWMHLEVPGQATLRALDQFLRDVWLECCGHLSEFTIEGRRYSDRGTDIDDWLGMDSGGGSLDTKLKNVLAPGQKFEHAYDFGSTTHLRLKVVAEGQSTLTRNEIKVLARNEPPAIPCEECGKPATQVCALCIYSGEGWLCDECAARHDCDEPVFLPVVNSPRVGVCAYTG
jgi:hypothetical protein